MTQTSNTSTCVGRERTCTQCGNIYRSPRNSSRYCTAACRKKANRGTAPTGGSKAGPSGFTIITKALLKTGFVGRIGSASKRSTEAPTYALLVPFEYALEELLFQFNRKGFGYVSRDEFVEALRRDAIQSSHTRSPEATDRNRYRARQQQRINRAS